MKTHKPLPFIAFVFITAGVTLVVSLSAYLLVQLLASGTPASRTWTIGYPVTAVAISSNDQQMAVGVRTGTIQIYQMNGGSIEYTLKGHTTAVKTLVFSADGQVLASADDHGAVNLWRTQDGTLIRSLTEQPVTNQGTFALAFDPNGKILASGGADNKVRLWMLTSGQLLETLDGLPSSTRPWWKASILSLHYSPDGRLVSVINDNDAIQQWFVPNGTPSYGQEGPGRQTTSSHLRSSAVAPSGQLVASTYVGIPDIYIWQPTTGQQLLILNKHRTDIWSLAFSPDGQLLASGGGRSGVSDNDLFPVRDTTIYIWQTADGHDLLKFTGHTDNINSLAWSSSGRLLISGSEDGTVRSWKVK
jgi:WD40 repeat protein